MFPKIGTDYRLYRKLHMVHLRGKVPVTSIHSLLVKKSVVVNVYKNNNMHCNVSG